MDNASLTTTDITGSSCCTPERRQTDRFEHSVNRHITSLFPHLHTHLSPFSPSLITLMVSVDVKHNVYFEVIELIFNTQSTMMVTQVSERRQADS